MTRRFDFRVTAFVLVGFFVTLLAGCSGSTKPRPRTDDCETCLVPRTSPANVLKDLRIIYGVMDNNVTTPQQAHSLADLYRTLFHPDFKFYFLPADTPPGFPEGWWGRNEEVADFDSLMTLRALGVVSEVQLSWTPGAAEPDNRIDPNPPYALLHPGWMWVHVTSVFFEVRQGDTIYRVPNGLADFYFAPDPADSTLWVITEWWDRQPAGSPNRSRSGSPVSAHQLTTWGKIKGLFR